MADEEKIADGILDQHDAGWETFVYGNGRSISRESMERCRLDMRDAITAALIAAGEKARRDENEACAKVADDFRDVMLNTDLQVEPLLWLDGAEHAARDVASAIRARVATKPEDRA